MFLDLLIILMAALSLLKNLLYELYNYYASIHNKGASRKKIKAKCISSISHKAEFEWGIVFFLKDMDKLYPFPQRGSKEKCVQSGNPSTDTCT